MPPNETMVSPRRTYAQPKLPLELLPRARRRLEPTPAPEPSVLLAEKGDPPPPPPPPAPLRRTCEPEEVWADLEGAAREKLRKDWIHVMREVSSDGRQL
jgi:hypothetical protein